MNFYFYKHDIDLKIIRLKENKKRRKHYLILAHIPIQGDGIARIKEIKYKTYKKSKKDAEKSFFKRVKNDFGFEMKIKNSVDFILEG